MRADPVWMESEMRTAWLKAAGKLALGLCVVGAVLGIRIVTVAVDAGKSASDGIAASAEQTQANAGGVREVAPPAADALEPDDSSMGGLASGLLDRLPGTAEMPHAGDRMVSCTLGGAIRFMRADDCAMRGGESTVFESTR